MLQYPVVWKFSRRPFIPVLEADAEGKNKLDEMAMLESAVALIEKAMEFNGRPLPEEPKVKPSCVIMAHFSIIFPDEEQFQKFIDNFMHK